MKRKQITEKGRRLAIVLLTSFCSLFSVFSFASPPEAFFSGQDHIDQQIITLMDGSRQRMDMALYEFSSRPLAQALSRAADRGVQVRLVLDAHVAAEKTTLANLAGIRGLTLRFDGSRNGNAGLMHHKFLIVDGATVVTGSYNWTASAEHMNYEDILIENTSGLVSRYESEFGRLWNAGREVRLFAMRKAAMGRPLKPHKHPIKNRSYHHRHRSHH